MTAGQKQLRALRVASCEVVVLCPQVIMDGRSATITTMALLLMALTSSAATAGIPGGRLQQACRLLECQLSQAMCIGSFGTFGTKKSGNKALQQSRVIVSRPARHASAYQVAAAAPCMHALTFLQQHCHPFNTQKLSPTN
jgi:hypothetical protein